DALDAAKIPLSVNVKFFFEGGEEAGSPNLAAVLAENSEALAADAWLPCDGPGPPSRPPPGVFGAGGGLPLRRTGHGPSRAVHSGHYGNFAPNPAALLASLLASLRGPKGDILVGGFNDDVRPLSGSERRALEELPRIERDLLRSFGLPESESPGS